MIDMVSSNTHFDSRSQTSLRLLASQKSLNKAENDDTDTPAKVYHYNKDEAAQQAWALIEQLGALVPILAQQLYPLPEGTDQLTPSPDVKEVDIKGKGKKNANVNVNVNESA